MSLPVTDDEIKIVRAIALRQIGRIVSRLSWKWERKRYAESGIAQRLNDIFNNAVSTTGAKENKGYLLRKAGTINDLTQFDNTIQTQINGYDKKIQTLMERWYRQENAYYAMFARMETAMSKLQSQQNSLAQIMAQG